MTKILDYILDKIFKEFETLKQNKKKMMINFIILYLIIFVLIGVSINEYYSIKKYQEILNVYNEKLELINDNIQISRIILESQTNQNSSAKELVTILEKYFQEKHKN